MAEYLAPGTKAPDFKVKDQDGNIVSLKDFKGKKVVIFFIRKTIPQVARKKHVI